MVRYKQVACSIEAWALVAAQFPLSAIQRTGKVGQGIPPVGTVGVTPDPNSYLLHAGDKLADRRASSVLYSLPYTTGYNQVTYIS